MVASHGAIGSGGKSNARRWLTMRFVHIIQINDPLNPSIAPLTREQVWRGLVRRAEYPKEFLPQLEHSLIVARGERTLARELNFGAFIVRDRVRLEPMECLTFDTEAAANVPSGSLSITIEEPGAELLQVRFSYAINRAALDDPETQRMYEDFTKSAYLETDIDCVKLIRRLAGEGAL